MTTWIVGTVVVLIALYAIVTFNRLVGLRQMANEGWSGIDVQLKRRADLVPNLVDTVKGYAAHERTTLEDVVKLRQQASAVALNDVAGRAQAEGALSLALGKLVALAEAYPDLKASANFLDLQKKLADLENEIQMARRYYNGTVRNFNTTAQSFPSSVVAGIGGFAARNYFELSAPGDAAVPQVAL